MDYPAWIGGSYQSQAGTADQERTVNWYVERMESRGASTRAALYPTPGVTTLATASVGAGRGHWGSNMHEFAVIGAGFFSLNQAGVSTLVSTVAVDNNPATICSNGDGTVELFVTSGGNGYVYDFGAATLTQIAALDGIATMGAFMDGYFLALNTLTGTLRISDLLDGTTWDPTQFAQRSTAADPWVCVKVLNRFIWLFGTKTSELWFDAGTSPFPFAQHQSGLIPYGVTAPFSVAEADGSLIWLGATSSGDGYVIKASGFTPEVISTFAIQRTISQLDVKADAVGESYQDHGHTFYVLSFPTEDTTSWAWDSNTQLWGERGTWYAEQSRYGAWRPRWHAFAYGEHRILDGQGPSIYRMSIDVATDVDSRPIRRVRRGPMLNSETIRLYYTSFELDVEVGLGLVTGQGSDPQVMMRFSNDAGRTWSNEQWRSAGKIGEYSKRVRWYRCGSGRRRVFEVSVTDPIPWRIVNCYVEIENLPQQMKSQLRAA